MSDWPIASDGDPGYVYFVRFGSAGPIKIGWSVDPRERIKALQTASPAELHVLRIAEGGRDFEQELHQRLAAHHIRGEWFQNCDEVRTAMRNAGRCVPKLQSPYTDKRCANCGSLAPLVAVGGVCAACEEFRNARDDDADPFDATPLRATV